MSNPVDAFTTIDTINSLEKTLSEKYLGTTQIVLSATSGRPVSAAVAPLAPYGNLANRYYPTVATYPNNPANFLTFFFIGTCALKFESKALSFAGVNSYI